MNATPVTVDPSLIFSNASWKPNPFSKSSLITYGVIFPVLAKGLAIIVTIIIVIVSLTLGIAVYGYKKATGPMTNGYYAGYSHTGSAPPQCNVKGAFTDQMPWVSLNDGKYGSGSDINEKLTRRAPEAEKFNDLSGRTQKMRFQSGIGKR
jgi:hypothetical protein